MIKIEYKEEIYTLEWDRRTIMWIEQQGLSLVNLQDQVFTSIYLLFKGMLKKHHSLIATNDSKVEGLLDELLRNGFNQQEFLGVAIEELQAFMETTQTSSKNKVVMTKS